MGAIAFSDAALSGQQSIVVFTTTLITNTNIITTAKESPSRLTIFLVHASFQICCFMKSLNTKWYSSNSFQIAHWGGY